MAFSVASLVDAARVQREEGETEIKLAWGVKTSCNHWLRVSARRDGEGWVIPLEYTPEPLERPKHWLPSPLGRGTAT